MCACIARSFNCCKNWLLYAVLTRTNFKRHDIKPDTDVETPKKAAGYHSDPFWHASDAFVFFVVVKCVQLNR